MKKNVVLLTGAFILIALGFQSAKVYGQESSSLDFSRKGGKTLDSYWDLYFETKDTKNLDKIIAYIETENLLLSNLNEAFAENKIDENVINDLEIKNTNGVFKSDYDTDILSIIALKNGDKEIANSMKYIYSLFPKDLLVRNSVKSSAIWSLFSNATQRVDVRIYLEHKLPELSLKSRKLFNDVYHFKSNIKELENSSRWNEDGYGASTTYYFYDDGTWIKYWYQKNVSKTGSVYTVDTIESKGTYNGNPTKDGSVQLTVTHERYWQQMDREIESLADSGKKIITDQNLIELPELKSARTDLIEVKNGKILK